MNLDVIYEDEALLVINKPSGMLSVPGRGAEKYDSAQSRCQALYPSAMAVHRLDMATSGILLISKHKEAERFYKKQFELRLPRKQYQALVAGHLRQEYGRFDAPMCVDWERRPRQKICYEHGKEALTDYRVLAQEALGSRVLLEPRTGRSHQLRLHLAHAGHPILGDEFYHPEGSASAPRLYLHAQRLDIARFQGGVLLLVAATPF